jgi:ribonuclease BN (tRNA processing enzyme)
MTDSPGKGANRRRGAFGSIVGLSVAVFTVFCLEPAMAQAPTPDSGVRLITLGTTAGPLPRKDRTQFSNLVIVRGVPYLIDAGDGVARRIVQAGVDFTRIGTIFITHPHNDHTGGLANLLNVAWQYARQKPIEVIGPPGTEETIQGALAFNRVDEEIRLSENRDKPLASIVRARNVAAGEIYRDDNITVSAIENSHFQFPPNSPGFGKYKSYGYRIETPTTSIVFTGDTGPSEQLKAFAKGADILVSEALAIDEIRTRLQRAGQWQKMSETERAGWEMHMSQEHITPEMAGEIAEAAGVKTLVLSHLSASGPDNDDYARFVQAAAKYFHGRLIAAKDLMEIWP